jgi:hypothetical protein
MPLSNIRMMGLIDRNNAHKTILRNVFVLLIIIKIDYKSIAFLAWFHNKKE